MPVEDLSASPELIHRNGRFYRPLVARTVPAGRGHELEEIRPVNGALSLADDGFLYFAGDPFPPGGEGRYRVGEVAGGDLVKLYPGLVLDAHPDGRRFRIGYRYLGTYRETPSLT